MKLTNIAWPVFWLGNIIPKKEGSIIFVEDEFLDKTTMEIHIERRIIDNKSIPKDTLGKRRLLITDKLFQLNKAIYFLADLIKLSKAGIWFIDNTGNCFTYQKTYSATLTCHKIKNILPGVTLGVLIEVEGIPQRFKLMYRPTDDEIYAGVLYIHNSYILYGLYTKPFKKSYRKV
jgi:hypothetical protein